MRDKAMQHDRERGFERESFLLPFIDTTKGHPTRLSDAAVALLFLFFAWKLVTG